MKSDRSNAALVWGSLLIGFGLLSLVGQVFRDYVNWSILWPFSVILFGCLFFAGMFLGGKQVSGLAIPGAIITGIGLLLLYQNLTRTWESWSYAWSLIIIFVGAGIYIMGLYNRDEGQKQSGYGVMKVGFVLFVIFGAFFEMIFSLSAGAGARSYLFPALMILLGVYLVVRRLGLLGGTKPGDDQALPASENK